MSPTRGAAGKRELRLQRASGGRGSGNIRRRSSRARYGRASTARRHSVCSAVATMFPWWSATPRPIVASLGELDHILIRTPEGIEMPFWTVAATAERRARRLDDPACRPHAYSARHRRRRIAASPMPICVVAGLESRTCCLASSRTIAGVSYTLEGHQREQSDFMATLRRGYLLSLVVVYRPARDSAGFVRAAAA